MELLFHMQFENRVALYPFDDHSVPPLDMMGAFCADVVAWLEQDPANVVVVHCKAGKGQCGGVTAGRRGEGDMLAGKPSLVT